MQEVEQELMSAAAAATARTAQQRPAAAVMDGAGVDGQEGVDAADSEESNDSAGVQEAGCDEAAAASSFDQGDVDAAIARLEAVTGRRRPGLSESV